MKQGLLFLFICLLTDLVYANAHFIIDGHNQRVLNKAGAQRVSTREFRCPNNQAIHEFQSRTDTHLRAISFSCAPILPSGKPDYSLSKNAQWFGSSDQGVINRHSSKLNSWVLGFYGHSGRRIDNVGSLHGFAADAILGEHWKSQRTFGGNGGSAYQQLCKKGYVLTGAKVGFDRRFVRSLQAVCSLVADQGQYTPITDDISLDVRHDLKQTTRSFVLDYQHQPNRELNFIVLSAERIQVLVKHGVNASFEKFDCARITQSGRANCSIPSPKSGRYYVTLKRFSSQGRTSSKLIVQKTQSISNGQRLSVRWDQSTWGQNAPYSKHYKLTVPESMDQLSFVSGDPHSLPSLKNGTAFDMQIISPSSRFIKTCDWQANEGNVCVINRPKAGAYFVSYKSSSILLNTDLHAQFSRTLENGKAIKNLHNQGSVTADQGRQYFTLDVPAEATNLKINTSGGSGQVALFVHHGDKVSETEFVCQSRQAHTFQSCEIANPKPGQYTILLNGKNTANQTVKYHGVQLLARYDVVSRQNALDDENEWNDIYLNVLVDTKGDFCFLSAFESGSGTEGLCPTPGPSLQISDQSSSSQLVSKNGVFRLILTPRGQLEIRNKFNTMIWQTPFNSQAASLGRSTARMLENGELALFNRKGKQYWSTQTGSSRASHFILRNNGVLYLECADGEKVWASHGEQPKSSQCSNTADILNSIELSLKLKLANEILCSSPEDFHTLCPGAGHYQFLSVKDSYLSINNQVNLLTDLISDSTGVSTGNFLIDAWNAHDTVNVRCLDYDDPQTSSNGCFTQNQIDESSLFEAMPDGMEILSERSQENNQFVRYLGKDYLVNTCYRYQTNDFYFDSLEELKNYSKEEFVARYYPKYSCKYHSLEQEKQHLKPYLEYENQFIAAEAAALQIVRTGEEVAIVGAALALSDGFVGFLLADTALAAPWTTLQMFGGSIFGSYQGVQALLNDYAALGGCESQACRNKIIVDMTMNSIMLAAPVIEHGYSAGSAAFKGEKLANSMMRFSDENYTSGQWLSEKELPQAMRDKYRLMILSSVDGHLANMISSDLQSSSPRLTKALLDLPEFVFNDEVFTHYLFEQVDEIKKGVSSVEQLSHTLEKINQEIKRSHCLTRRVLVKGACSGLSSIMKAAGANTGSTKPPQTENSISLFKQLNEDIDINQPGAAAPSLLNDWIKKNNNPANGWIHSVDGEFENGLLKSGLHTESGFKKFKETHNFIETEVLSPDFNENNQIQSHFSSHLSHSDSNKVRTIILPNGVKIRQFSSDLMTAHGYDSASVTIGSKQYKGVKSFFPNDWQNRSFGFQIIADNKALINRYFATGGELFKPIKAGDKLQIQQMKKVIKDQTMQQGLKITFKKHGKPVTAQVRGWEIKNGRAYPQYINLKGYWLYEQEGSTTGVKKVFFEIGFKLPYDNHIVNSQYEYKTATFYPSRKQGL